MFATFLIKQKIIEKEKGDKLKIKILILVFSIFFINLISANVLECSLNENYYQGGMQILYASNESVPDGISIDIRCSNLDRTQRLLSLSVVNASPSIFYESLSRNTIDFLRIDERDKILFSSPVIPTSLLNDSNEFSATISSLSEKNMSFETADCKKTINLPSKENLILEVGDKISPSSPIAGLAFVVILIALIIYFYVRRKKS